MIIQLQKHSDGVIGISYTHGDTIINYGVAEDYERKWLARQFIDIAEKLLEGIKDETT